MFSCCQPRTVGVAVAVGVEEVQEVQIVAEIQEVQIYFLSFQERDQELPERRINVKYQSRNNHVNTMESRPIKSLVLSPLSVSRFRATRRTLEYADAHESTHCLPAVLVRAPPTPTLSPRSKRQHKF